MLYQYVDDYHHREARKVLAIDPIPGFQDNIHDRRDS